MASEVESGFGAVEVPVCIVDSVCHDVDVSDVSILIGVLFDRIASVGSVLVAWYWAPCVRSSV